MRAAVYDRQGSPEVLAIREIEKPAVAADGVLVRVHAASINAMDWYFLTGTPYAVRVAGPLLGPRRQVPGTDLAGTVEAVGGGVRQFRPGDEVFGTGRGTFAEYVCAAEARLARKPASVTFERAAAVPVAGLTALQGLRDHGRIQPGQDVLINGASGGVGTFAVQLARSFGARVTGVCGPGHVDVVRSLGADEVVDYTREDFTRTGQRYDLALDVAGGRPWRQCRRVMKPGARWILTGGPRTNRWFGPMPHLAGMMLASRGDRRRVAVFTARVNQPDLVVLATLLEEGRVRPVVDECYDLTAAAAAFRRFGEGHPHGKIVVTVRSADRG